MCEGYATAMHVLPDGDRTRVGGVCPAWDASLMPLQCMAGVPWVPW